jgi:putative ABC transport system substrate-binding protein
VHRLGILVPTFLPTRRANLLKALEAYGYREGDNLAVEGRTADGKLERLPQLAEELVRAPVDVVVAFTTPGTQAAISTGTKIPIIMWAGDPVGSGFVASMARPGGTVTGITDAAGATATKRLAILREVVPTATRIAVFANPDYPIVAVQIQEIGRSARELGLEVRVFSTLDDLQNAFEEAVAWRAGAVLRVLAEGSLDLSRAQAELLLAHRLPAMLVSPRDVQNGGLLSYFPDTTELFAGMADYVHRILTGTPPGDLPDEHGWNGARCSRDRICH